VNAEIVASRSLEEQAVLNRPEENSASSPMANLPTVCKSCARSAARTGLPQTDLVSNPKAEGPNLLGRTLYSSPARLRLAENHGSVTVAVPHPADRSLGHKGRGQTRPRLVGFWRTGPLARARRPTSQLPFPGLFHPLPLL